MALSKEMLDMAVRIIGTAPANNLLGFKEKTLGTGFILSIPSETLGGVHYAHVLTAHHVIKGQQKPLVQVSNPFAPGELYPAFGLEDWRQPLPGVDLALAFIPNENDEGGDQYLRG